jgi:5-methyltetrahydropteroyltriglutamate--homocysteine methyltransferase
MPRILTTHAGSLPRPPDLVRLLARLSRNEPVDPGELDGLIDRAVASVVDDQAEAGIDLVNDGEQGRESFFTYVQHRMSGFGRGADVAPRRWQDVDDFPGFAEIRRAQRDPGQGGEQVSLVRPPAAIGPIAYADTGAIDREIERLAGATAGRGFAGTFLTAPSPGIVVAAMADRHYHDDGAYLEAVAGALAVEYRRIVEAGLLLQIDAPDLAMERHGRFAGRPVDEFLAFAGDVVDAINGAVTGLDRRRIRLHVCWGNYGGPHIHDVALSDLVEVLYGAEVGGIVVSGANPRHEHEYRVFEDHGLPDGWTLAAGVIDTTTNYVEHPEVVADRLERVIDAVGDPSRVMACTDCGFDTAAGFSTVAPDVAWAKLRAMREGADLASSRVFG